jgi:hypothetical protein
MKTVKINAVLIQGPEGYFIHGTNAETPSQMFKKMSPLWDFNPAVETVHYVELSVNLPDFETGKIWPDELNALVPIDPEDDGFCE